MDTRKDRGTEGAPKDAIDQFKRRLDQTRLSGEEKSALLRASQRLARDMSNLQFRLDRTRREKRTLSTLLARTSEDLENLQN